MTAAIRVPIVVVLALAGAPLADGAPRKPHPVASTATSAALPVVPGTGAPRPVPFGSYCFTPLGRIGPVPVAPLGSPCQGSSAQGPVAGQIME